MREGIGEGRGSLDCGEVDLANVIAGGMNKQMFISFWCWDACTHESLNPNVALACEIVIWREILEIFL